MDLSFATVIYFADGIPAAPVSAGSEPTQQDAVADTFNAMTSDRPYRSALPLDVAIREIEDQAGSQFDPAVARTFLAVLAEDDIAEHEPLAKMPSGPRRACQDRCGST